MISGLRNFLWKSYRTTGTLTAIGIVAMSQTDITVHNFLGFSSNKQNDESNEPTKTFIWGNGHYVSGSPVAFANFEPKHIKTFDGKESPHMRQIYFAEGIEAGIDLKGNLYGWIKPKLMSSTDKPDSNHKRDGVTQIDGEGNNKHVEFTRKFMWILKTDGTVHQVPISFEIDPDNGAMINFQIGSKMRKITALQNIKQIACGADHFVALDDGGRVYTMGDDTLGQCGHGSEGRITAGPFYEKRVSAPKLLESLQGVQKIASGENHSLAIMSDGHVVGWGSNQTMQLSHEKEVSTKDNPLLVSYSPIRIDRNMNENIVTDIAAGDGFSMFVTKHKHNNETEVFGCGNNLNGELGVGSLRHVQDVTKVEGLSNYKLQGAPEGEDPNIRIKYISCGKQHCMALLNFGAILEWGGNGKGQMGNKKRVSAESPLIVGRFQNSKVRNINCGSFNSAVVVTDTTANSTSTSGSNKK